MAITAAEVNKLRQMTGSGMMDCKNALVEADGDFDKAIDILRKKGQKVAAKRADRAAGEGYVIAQTNAEHTFGVIMILNCETDFVAKTNDFVDCAKQINDFAIANKIKDLAQLMSSSIEGRTIEQILTELTGKTGEKVEISQYQSMEKPYVAFYNHMGNRLASLVAFSKGGSTLDLAGHEIAMQIAAMNPVAIDQDSVPQATIEHELELAREITRQEGKPEEMIEKIAQGKLNKFFKENTLLNQEFIKDSKKIVAQYLKEATGDATCEGFFRFQLGE